MSIIRLYRMYRRIRFLTRCQAFSHALRTYRHGF
jgi:hypothetical protein